MLPKFDSPSLLKLLLSEAKQIPGINCMKG